MEAGKHLEPGEGWGEGGEVGARLQSLLELVRREHHRTELSPERRAEIREHVLDRLARYEVQRWRRRTLVAVASTALLAGLMLMLVIRARAG